MNVSPAAFLIETSILSASSVMSQSGSMTAITSESPGWKRNASHAVTLPLSSVSSKMKLTFASLNELSI